MKLKLCALACFLLVLSNCSRYYDWAQSTFTSGTKRELCIPTDRFACSTAIYDQFRTVGLFDIVWLNSIARSEFVKLRCHRQQLSPMQKQELINRQERELEKNLVFYVLMPALDIDSLPLEPNSPAPWSVSLQINNERSYQPTEIKLIELEPEFAYLFDCFYLRDSFIRFRRAYMVTFDALDDLREPIIKPGNTCIKMTISSIEYCTSCEWQIPESNKIIC